MNKEKILEALGKLRKENKERKFKQTVDLIINLKSFDIKKNSVNLFLNLPHKIKNVKVAGFLEAKSELIDSILKQDFGKYKDKKKIKNLVRKYDFFIANANLMPLIATNFGRYLGSAGKMPNPQLGILKKESREEIEAILRKIEKMARVKSKEPSLKFNIGKEDMKDEEIADNVLTAYNNILNSLPKKNENIKSVMIKFTMNKPIKLEI